MFYSLCQYFRFRLSWRSFWSMLVLDSMEYFSNFQKGFEIISYNYLWLFLGVFWESFEDYLRIKKILTGMFWSMKFNAEQINKEYFHWKVLVGSGVYFHLKVLFSLYMISHWFTFVPGTPFSKCLSHQQEQLTIAQHLSCLCCQFWIAICMS